MTALSNYSLEKPRVSVCISIFATLILFIGPTSIRGQQYMETTYALPTEYWSSQYSPGNAWDATVVGSQQLSYTFYGDYFCETTWGEPWGGERFNLYAAVMAGHDVTPPHWAKIGDTVAFVVEDRTANIIWTCQESWEIVYTALNGFASGRVFGDESEIDNPAPTQWELMFSPEYQARGWSSTDVTEAPYTQAMKDQLASIEERANFSNQIHEALNSGTAVIVKDHEGNFEEILLPKEYKGRNAWIGTDWLGTACVVVEKSETEKAIDILFGNWDSILAIISGQTISVINGAIARDPL